MARIVICGIAGKSNSTHRSATPTMGARTAASPRRAVAPYSVGSGSFWLEMCPSYFAPYCDSGLVPIQVWIPFSSPPSILVALRLPTAR